MAKPYHPNNLALQQYPHWRVKVLAWVGLALGIQFKIDGIPYGAAYRPSGRNGVISMAKKPHKPMKPKPGC